MASKRKPEGTAVRDGQCWAVPVPKLGFCPLVIARAPKPKADVDFAFAYMKVELTPDLPDPASVGHVETWPKAWLGLVATTQLRKGRWKLLGELPGFDPDAWPIPPSRASNVDEREPVEEWSKYPGGERWSIQTTSDEATMTIIANDPATRADALKFPLIDTVTAVSRLETAIRTHFKGLRPGVWDQEFSVQRYPAGSVAIWRDYAAKVRAGWSPGSVSWLPAGRKTDRALAAGMWLGLPLAGGGFGAAMLVHKQKPHEQFFSDAVVMTMRRKWDRWPTLSDVVSLRAADGAMLAPTTMIAVRDGRWRVLGTQPDFTPGAWPCPIAWDGLPRAVLRGQISVRVERAKTVELNIDPEILRLDPLAGKLCRCMAFPTFIENYTTDVLAGRHKPPPSTFPADPHITPHLVTPDRVAAWQTINAAIQKALGGEYR